MATKERVSVSTEKEAKTGTRVCHCRALKMRAVVILSSEFGVFGREGVQKNAASLSLSQSRPVVGIGSWSILESTFCDCHRLGF